MTAIWEKWNDYKLGQYYEEANEKIEKKMKTERMYGKLSERELKEIKDELRELAKT